MTENNELADMVEMLAADQVLADPEQPETIRILKEDLETVADWARDNEWEKVRQTVRELIAESDELLEEGAAEDTDFLDRVGQLTTGLQTAAKEGGSEDDVDLPGSSDDEASPQDDEAADDAEEDETEQPEGDAVDDDGEETPDSPEEDEEQGAETAELCADPDMIADFIQECNEHLSEAEARLLDLETDPEHQESLHAVFRAFHTIKGVAGFLQLDHIEEVSHKAENVLDQARNGELTLEGAAADVIFDSVDIVRKMVDDVREAVEQGQDLPEYPEKNDLMDRLQAVESGEEVESDEPPETDPDKRIGEILVEQGSVSDEDVSEAVKNQDKNQGAKKLGEELVQKGKTKAKDVAKGLRSQKKARQGTGQAIRETIRVDAQRLDRLIEGIGEMVIAESMVSQAVDKQDVHSGEVLRKLDRLDKITRELQETGMSLRMVPLRSTFQKMARLVRDLSRKAGKKVDFTMSGKDTELDKSIVDRIGDPLVHLVRNAVDHGLEMPEERAEAGKPETGHIELRAYHQGGNIFIEIEDDGSGLDREKLLSKARERGLVRDGSDMSDRQVYNLIFEAGFSTCEEVTDVSGRGVGMDVVKKNIEALRGQVDVESTPGEGSIFTLRLPLTLAIIDGMVVKVGSQRFILPTLAMVQTVRPRSEQLKRILNRGTMLEFRGKQLPVFCLADCFGVDDASTDLTSALVVVVESEGEKVGLVVDDLLGQQQIVIKSLGPLLRRVPGMAGGAIMPDGEVALIADISGLIGLAKVGSEWQDDKRKTGDHEAITNDTAPSLEDATAQ